VKSGLPSRLNMPANRTAELTTAERGDEVNTQTSLLQQTTTEAAEPTRLQEHNAVAVEDKSLPAYQILEAQGEQEGRGSLFVP